MKIKKYIITFIILIFSANIIFGQNTIQDAIKFKKIAKENFDKQNYNQAMNNINKSIEILVLHDNNKLEGECFLLAANIYSIKGEANYALKYYLKSEERYKKINSSDTLSLIYSQIALIYFNINAFEKATEYFIKSYSINNGFNNSQKTIEILNYTGNSFYNLRNYTQAEVYYIKMKETAVALKDTNNIIKSLEKIISINKKQKKYQEAIDNNIKIYDLYISQNNIAGRALTLNNIGYNYVNLQKYDQAISYFQESIFYQEKTYISKDVTARTNTNIGVCYQNLGNYKEAIEYLLKANEIWTKQNNKLEKAKICNLIALVYFQNNDLYNASTFSEESIQYAEQANDKQVLQNCYETYSRILQAGNDYQNALVYYKKYLTIRDSLLLELRLSEQELARKILELEKSEKELKLKLAEEEIQEMLLKQYKLENEKKEKENEILRRNKELQEAELLQQKYTLSIEKQKRQALEKQKEIDALENQKKIQKLELEQTEVESKKREAEISEKEKEMALLKSEQERQNLLLDKNKAAQRFFKWIVLLFAIILVLIVIVLILSRRANRRLSKQKNKILEQNTKLNSQKEELSAQKDEVQSANEEITLHRNVLQQKHKQITDSITYASRIQNAMLPDNKGFTNYFPKHFIIFKPRDIVSGDFYWVKKITQKNDSSIIIAAADCTGHGVPGAFVSMLGMSLLNEIVNKKRDIQANQILNNLREEIKISLKQHGRENESKDGLDIALCIFNKKEKKLQYAGAYNPLYIIRDKKIEQKDEKIQKNNNSKIRIFQQEKIENKTINKQLIEIKADFQPIGIYIKERPFTNFQLNIYKNDLFYMFSDGFIDQFGGKESRKYSSKRFKKKLLEINEKTMKEQKQVLESELEKWKSTNKIHKQLDDVLVLGIKI